MKPTYIFAAAVLTLAGCATTTPEQQAAINAQAARTVSCSGQDDCAVKWGRAVKWILDNSAFKIQTQSDTMISTMGPLPNDPTPTFTVTKIAEGNGAYEFDFRAWCDNMFGCVPTNARSKAGFVMAVMDTPAGG
jgi:hypothetical protein